MRHLRVGALVALSMGLGAIACDQGTPPVRDAELEALRNTRVAGVAVAPPVRMVSRDQIGRCRLHADLGVRFERRFDPAALERQLAFRRALVSAWADDAQLIRVELGCEPDLLVVDLATTWFSKSEGEVLHGEDPDHALAVERRALRAELSSADVVRALHRRAGHWGPPLVVRPSPGPE